MMGRLIDAEILAKEVKSLRMTLVGGPRSGKGFFAECMKQYLESVLRIIDEQPTVDAVSVVHGKWVEHKWAEECDGLLISNYECSECNSWERDNKNFCPNCGAKMDKGE